MKEELKYSASNETLEDCVINHMASFLSSSLILLSSIASHKFIAKIFAL